jgi:hypothetical protein
LNTEDFKPRQGVRIAVFAVFVLLLALADQVWFSTPL